VNLKKRQVKLARVSHFRVIMFLPLPRPVGLRGYLGFWKVGAWVPESVGDDDAAELDDHVVEGRFGFGGVPPGPFPVVVRVGWVMSGG
jgi:hypothetical protein